MEKNLIRTATHGCPQHIDELVALCLLRRWAEQRGQQIEVHFLSREQIAARQPYDVLIDIGQEFDVARGRFDHHQHSFEVAGRSAAGLIFDALHADDPHRAYLSGCGTIAERVRRDCRDLVHPNCVVQTVKQVAAGWFGDAV